MQENHNRRKKKQYPLRVNDDLMEWVSGRAERNNRSVNGEINQILGNAKDAEDEKEEKPCQ